MKSLLHGATLVACAFALTGCSAAPEDIKAANADMVPYQHLTCQQLSDYKQTIDKLYAKASDKENSARAEDAVGLLLLGFPMGSAIDAGTDKQIADLKGVEAAIQTSEATDQCPPAGTKLSAN